MKAMSREEKNRKVEKWYYDNIDPTKMEVQASLPSQCKTDWSMYEKACSQEKLMVFRLLKDATDHMLIKYNYKGNGRPPAYYGDIVKSLCIRAYSQYSSWRAESELRIAKSMGIIDEVYKRSTLNKYLQSKKVTKLLHRLLRVMAEPISAIEMYFAVDATGFSNKYGNIRWMKIRHTKEEIKKAKDFSKVNLISGVKTNVVCSVDITRGHAHESPHFKKLLDDTAKLFTIKELSADAGYLSKNNVKAIADKGAIPFIPGKKTVNVPQNGVYTAWGCMLRMWKYNQDFFYKRYHKRSNVESTFSMIKKRFGDFCRGKKPVSQENEILAKIVCHNAVVLAEAWLSYDLRKGFMAT